MRTQLYAHNKTAYQKIVAAFEKADRTCVVHPTGTGKSYLIAAVSESYKKVLILGPNIFVLDQVHNVLKWRDSKKAHGSVEYMTYSLLIMKDEMPTGYDLICLDEFHRAGAPEWGDAVDRLLDHNPNAKVLGTTATPIRFLDNNRDMADELFGGNIASYMTLKDAFDRNILVTPRFVTGLFEFDKVVEEFKIRIKKSKRIDENEKKKRMTRINNLRLDWERSHGMPQILRKHIDKNAKRIIVFCGNIDKLMDMEQTIRLWFQQAGTKIADVYMMHTYMTDRELSQAMTDFETDTDEGVKLMLSVNMLNEGVHIPRVNAVILLRTTSSKIIYLQQIGRCLTAEKRDKPIILDMVDNITTTNIVHDIKEGYDWFAHQQLKDKEEQEPRETRDFVVYDYTLGVRQAIEKLVPVEWMPRSFEDRLAQATAFCEKNGRPPGKYDKVEELRNWHVLRDHYKGRQEVKELIEKYGNWMTRERKIEWLQQYVAKNGKLPGDGKNISDEQLRELRIYQTLRDERPCDPRVQELIDKYSIIKSDERLLQDYLDFVEKNGRLPEHIHRKTPKDEFNLADTVQRRLKDHPQILALWEKYQKKRRKPYRSVEEKLEEVAAFIEHEGRLPVRSDGEIHKTWIELERNNRRHVVPAFVELRNKYSRKKSDEEIAADAQKVIDFMVANGRRPSENKESRLYFVMKSLLKSHPNHQKVQEMAIVKEANGSLMSDDELKSRIKAFVNKYNRLPRTRYNAEETRLRSAWNGRKNRLIAEDPEMRAIYEMYTLRRPSFDDFYQAVADFCQREDRLPKKKDGDIYRMWDRMRSTYLHEPKVKNLAEKYGYKPGEPKLDIEAILDEIEAFTIEHGRMPFTTSSDRTEKKLARHWARFKRRYADNPKLIAIKERFPIQNKK